MVFGDFPEIKEISIIFVYHNSEFTFDKQSSGDNFAPYFLHIVFVVESEVFFVDIDAHLHFAIKGNFEIRRLFNGFYFRNNEATFFKKFNDFVINAINFFSKRE